MKTTVEIPGPLFEPVKRLAAKRGTTMKALVEQGLRTVLAEGALTHQNCYPS